MSPRMSLAAVLACLLWAGGAAAGTGAARAAVLDVPRALQGAWYIGQTCSNVSAYVFRGNDWMVRISQQPGSRTIVADSSRFTVLKVAPDGSTLTSSYWRDPATDTVVPATVRIRPSERGIESGYASPPDAARLPDVSELRCDAPEIEGKPWQFASLYLASLTSVLGEVAAVQRDCNGDVHACAAGIIGVLDIERDGKVSTADLTDFFRRASKLALLIGRKVSGTNTLHAEFTLGDVLRAEFWTSVGGPVVAQIVMSNIDYNGDGFIEQDELETFLRQVKLPSGQELLQQLVESAKSSASQTLQSLNALQEILRIFGSR